MLKKYNKFILFLLAFHLIFNFNGFANNEKKIDSLKKNCKSGFS